MNSHRPRKRFGQHFLVDQSIISAIVRAVAPTTTDHVVEIGPGQRALTDSLSRASGQLSLIEIDRDLVRSLHAAYQDQSHIRVIEADALTQDFSAMGSDLRVVGNLPYNISTPLLFHLLDHQHAIRDMHFMLQKEVVDRIAAEAGEKAYGRLSVMVARSLTAEALFDVPPEAFDPPPKVQSAVVRLTPKPQQQRLGQSPGFAALVKQAFSMRRKTLRNSLRDWLTPDDIEACGIDPSRRPETLSISEFDALARKANASETDCTS
ncbi:MAG: 16S rRNA (adenine(1518)-N(6)/adenine(1519)-N(6))-dimethyltransferase RsmA [Pseudomonadota bacterium]